MGLEPVEGDLHGGVGGNFYRRTGRQEEQDF
jgi:hypothetical protein